MLDAGLTVLEPAVYVRFSHQMYSLAIRVQGQEINGEEQQCLSFFFLKSTDVKGKEIAPTHQAWCNLSRYLVHETFRAHWVWRWRRVKPTSIEEDANGGNRPLRSTWCGLF